MTAPGTNRQLAGSIFPRKEQGCNGGSDGAQLADGVEMVLRDPILSLGARHSHRPDVSMEPKVFLPRKLASEMVPGTFTLGTQWELLQGELGLDVWFSRWAQEEG